MILSDLQITNGTASTLSKISDGIWKFELSPDDNSTAQIIGVQISGMDVATETFQESFSDGSINIPYNPSSSSFSSASESFWSVGSYGRFQISATDATSISVSNLPIGLDYNSTSREIYGTPEAAGNSTISLTAFNPVHGDISINHSLQIIDPGQFSSELEISIDPDATHSKPSNFQGLAVQFDASLLGDSNGSKITNWNDSSGNARDLDQVRAHRFFCKVRN